MNDGDRVEKFLKWSKTHPVAFIVVIFGIIVISIGSFTDSVDKILTFKNKYLTKQISTSDQEVPGKRTATKETTKEAAQTPKSLAKADPAVRKSNVGQKIAETRKQTASRQAELESQNARSTTPNGTLTGGKETASLDTDVKPAPRIGPSDGLGQVRNQELGKRTKDPTPPAATPTSELSSIGESRSQTKDHASTVAKEDKTVDIRQSVSFSVTALKGETTSDRVRSVRALLISLPDDLNGKEIARLLDRETTTHREQILKLLVTKIRPRSLRAADIPEILGGETTSNRINCIEILAPYIEEPISGFAAAKILGSETYSHRVRALQPIAPLLKHPLSEEELAAILKGTSTTDRTQAIDLITKGNKERK